MIRTSILTLAFAALATACSNNPEPKNIAASSACGQLGNSQPVLERFYAPGGVHSVRAVKEKEFIARAIQPTRTMGADLYVHAPADVSQEYLQRVLTCHAAQGQARHPNDPLHPASGAIAEVEVRSAGGSLAVRVVGSDHEAGSEIYQRAKALTEGSVTVEQVSAAPRSSVTF